MLCLVHAHLIMTGESFFACRCVRLDGANYNNNRNNTTRNWIVLLNILNLKRKITQHYLDWGWLFIFHNKNGVLIRAIYSPTDMVIILNGLSSRRIQEADSFPLLTPPPFTSPLRMYLAQYLREFMLAH